MTVMMMMMVPEPLLTAEFVFVVSRLPLPLLPFVVVAKTLLADIHTSVPTG
jgi:hypothetical protein